MVIKTIKEPTDIILMTLEHTSDRMDNAIELNDDFESIYFNGKKIKYETDGFLHLINKKDISIEEFDLEQMESILDWEPFILFKGVMGDIELEVYTLKYGPQGYERDKLVSDNEYSLNDAIAHQFDYNIRFNLKIKYEDKIIIDTVEKFKEIVTK